MYDGRDKTFIFWTYETNRQNTTVNNNWTIPTMAYRNGDFSNPALWTKKVLGTDVLGRQILDGTIYDPATTRTVVVMATSYVVRDPFEGNIIPADYARDTVAMNLQAKIPQPTNLNATLNNL